MTARTRRRDRAGRLAALLGAAAACGCGTTLIVRSIDVPELAAATCPGEAASPELEACVGARRALYDAPGGIVVNGRMRYAVTLERRADVAVAVAPPTHLEGVDPARLLSVNYRRQPFASGRLVLSLDARQAIETIGIEGDPGSVSIVHSLGQAAAARREILEAQEKAREQED